MDADWRANSKGLLMNVRAISVSLLLGLVAIAGCGRGPAKYKLTGKVTYGDKPIAMGTMILEPLEGVANADTVANAEIRAGRYEAEVVGGPHKVLIRDLSPEAGTPGARSLFVYEYYTKLDLPKESSQPVERDVEIPTTHK
jgi:hypothetical protein